MTAARRRAPNPAKRTRRAASSPSRARTGEHAAAQRSPRAVGVAIVTSFCFEILPPTKRIVPRASETAICPVPVAGL